MAQMSDNEKVIAEGIISDITTEISFEDVIRSIENIIDILEKVKVEDNNRDLDCLLILKGFYCEERLVGKPRRVAILASSIRCIEENFAEMYTDPDKTETKKVPITVIIMNEGGTLNVLDPFEEVASKWLNYTSAFPQKNAFQREGYFNKTLKACLFPQSEQPEFRDPMSEMLDKE